MVYILAINGKFLITAELKNRQEEDLDALNTIEANINRSIKKIPCDIISERLARIYSKRTMLSLTVTLYQKNPRIGEVI